MVQQLSETSLVLEKLVEQTGLDPLKVVRVAEWLVDQGKLERRKDLSLRWKG